MVSREERLHKVSGLEIYWHSQWRVQNDTRYLNAEIVRPKGKTMVNCPRKTMTMID